MRRLLWFAAGIALLGLAGCPSTQAQPAVDMSGTLAGMSGAKVTLRWRK